MHPGSTIIYNHIKIPYLDVEPEDTRYPQFVKYSSYMNIFVRFEFVQIERLTEQILN